MYCSVLALVIGIVFTNAGIVYAQSKNPVLEQAQKSLQTHENQSNTIQIQTSNKSELDIQGKIVCKGSAACFNGNITKVVDGDTVDVNGIRIRLSLVDTPERGQINYTESRNFVIQLCPIGSIALVDQDDGQKGGSYGRMIGEVYCNYNPSNQNNTKNLNEEIIKSGYAHILTNLCTRSEFAKESWAARHGC
jgi:endonuclease YncB( thermonuclease family)